MNTSQTSQLTSVLALQLSQSKSTKTGTFTTGRNTDQFQTLLNEAQNNLSGKALFSSSSSSSIQATTEDVITDDSNPSSPVVDSSDDSASAGMGNYMMGISKVLKGQINKLTVEQVQKKQEQSKLPSELQDSFRLISSRTPLTEKDVMQKADSMYYYARSILADVKGCKDSEKIEASDKKVVVVAFSLSILVAEYHSDDAAKHLAELGKFSATQSGELHKMMHKILKSLVDGKSYEFVKEDPQGTARFDQIPKNVLEKLAQFSKDFLDSTKSDAPVEATDAATAPIVAETPAITSEEAAV